MIWLIIGILAAIFIPIVLYAIVEREYNKWDQKIKSRFKLFCIFIMVICFTLGLLGSSVVIVPAGTVGVHDLFGAVSEQEFPAGIAIKNPFAHVEMMSIKTHEIKETSEVPSQEGLIVRLEISILFKIKPVEANNIYKHIGKWYWDVVIIPQLRSVIREVTAKFEAKALYTTGRLNITRDIYDVLQPKLDERGIILERVLLRDIGLPVKLTEAIELKLTAEQQIEQKQFDVLTAEKEADRKRVEAKGIADANDIIALSLTENYLRWYWIENLDTHDSVYYVPIGEGGMPIFKEVGTNPGGTQE